ncbi:hypothetical protein TNCV_3580691 [Trichonephila clavipes]|nr:hypothetical protein TNCV_3580691 [Trichonephila clavipes]
MGFRSRRPTRVPLLNSRHQTACLAWAREHRDWSQSHFSAFGVAIEGNRSVVRFLEGISGDPPFLPEPSYSRASGDGPRNFEPWSSDEDDT